MAKQEKKKITKYADIPSAVLAQIKFAANLPPEKRDKAFDNIKATSKIELTNSKLLTEIRKEVPESKPSFKSADPVKLKEFAKARKIDIKEWESKKIEKDTPAE